MIVLLGAMLTINEVGATSNKLRIGGSGTDIATFRLIADEFEKLNPSIKVEVPDSIGSGGAVKAVKSGWLDIGLMSRPLKSSELSSKLVSYLYGTTPLVFAVSSTHSVSSVSPKQLEAIFNGELTKWNSKDEIRLILRPKSDSDTLLLLDKYPHLKASINKAHLQRGIPIAISDQDAIKYLKDLPGAFGTTTLALLLSEPNDVKVLALDGVAPSVENTNYPLNKELFIVLPNKVSDETKKFIEYMRSPKCIEIFKRTGHRIIEFSPAF